MTNPDIGAIAIIKSKITNLFWEITLLIFILSEKKQRKKI